jgi:hypothetical protein
MIVSGIVIAVCAACRDEIQNRITTPPETLPETPIEHYARKGKMPPAGCQYKLKGQKLSGDASPYNCNAVCDDRQTLCPRHILVVQAEGDELRRKEKVKEEKRLANLRAGSRR